MRAQVSWKDKLRFEATADSGHLVVIDAKPEAGGENKGPRPMELLLMGLGGCTGIDMILILQKMRIAFDRVDVVLDGARATGQPERFTDITLTYEVDAPDAPLDKVERAVRLSQEKYCSAAHSLNARLEAVIVLNGVRHELSAEPAP